MRSRPSGSNPAPICTGGSAICASAMGLRDEARAWYLLALGDQPNDPVSRAAIQRLAAPGVLVGVPYDTPSNPHAGNTDPGPAIQHR